MKLYIIGAGPGDPELLTIKAERIIRCADIIIYAGSLVNKDLLSLAKGDSLIYDSSKMSQDEIFKIIHGAIDSNKVIARIHSGDPSIYSAVQEEISLCEREDIPFEIIPGVSSLSSSAAALRQELTLPGITQTVIITRLSGRTKVPKRESLRLLSKIKATLVIFLSIDKIDRVIKELSLGYDLNTPVAVVFKASWPDEKILMGRLKDIAKKVKALGIKRQALIFIGDVLNKKGFKESKVYK